MPSKSDPQLSGRHFEGVRVVASALARLSISVRSRSWTLLDRDVMLSLSRFGLPRRDGWRRPSASSVFLSFRFPLTCIPTPPIPQAGGHPPRKPPTPYSRLQTGGEETGSATIVRGRGRTTPGGRADRPTSPANNPPLHPSPILAPEDPSRWLRSLRGDLGTRRRGRRRRSIAGGGRPSDRPPAPLPRGALPGRLLDRGGVRGPRELRVWAPGGVAGRNVGEGGAGVGGRPPQRGRRGTPEESGEEGGRGAPPGEDPRRGGRQEGARQRHDRRRAPVHVTCLLTKTRLYLAFEVDDWSRPNYPSTSMYGPWEGWPLNLQFTRPSDHSGMVVPEPPKSVGKSSNLGSPSLILYVALL